MCLGHLSTLSLKENEPDGLQMAENHPQSISSVKRPVRRSFNRM